MSQESIELILYKIAELDKKVEELRADQKASAAKTTCPAPGSCLVLARDVEQLKRNEESREARIRVIESHIDQAKGVGLAGKMIWAFIGAGGLYAISSLISAIGK